MIARVGIGLDGVPFELCRERGIRVSYTPKPRLLQLENLQ